MLTLDMETSQLDSKNPRIRLKNNTAGSMRMACAERVWGVLLNTQKICVFHFSTLESVLLVEPARIDTQSKFVFDTLMELVFLGEIVSTSTLLTRMEFTSLR